jgi:transposase-like protein
VAIAEHLADGCGVRATARLCKVSRNTVLRFTQRFGNGCDRRFGHLYAAAVAFFEAAGRF